MIIDIDAKDEQLQTPVDNPLWRESFWLDACDAENGIRVVVYAHARPPGQYCDLFVTIVGVGPEPIVHDVHGQPYTTVHEGAVASLDCLRYAFTEVGRGIAVDFNIAGATLKLSFTATGPVYDYDWVEWTSSRHYEQFGLVRGVIETADRTVEFNGYGTRDHAWGLRANVPWRRWLWITARFPGDKGWGACIVDSEEPLLLGYFCDDKPEETTFGQFSLEGTGDNLRAASLTLRSPSHETIARIRPTFTMSRSGSDPTKGGAYHYYFVEVDDERYGRGYGLLDTYSTPGYESDLEPMTAIGPP